MRRHLVTVALVLGVIETARQALSLATIVWFSAKAALGIAEPFITAEPFAWRHFVGVFWSLVALTWTALVSYAAVHVCRRIATESATAPR